jgi:hypothetical protein
MPYGSINADLVVGTNGGKISPENTFGFRNRIINGACVIDQRNAGASVATSSGTTVYSLDRWIATYAQTSKFTIQQNAGSVTPPAGYANYLGVTSSSNYAVVAGDYFSIAQFLEGNNTYDLGWGTANAKTITISFWVYSSLTGSFGGCISNYAQTRNYPFLYTINSANTWQQINVTIAGDTGGTWVGATNAGSVKLFFTLGYGSTFSGPAGAWASSSATAPTGATSVVGTNGATFYITGVQLEVGSNATSFEYRPYGAELALCQRYYYKTYSQGTNPASATASGTRGGSAYNGGTGIAGNFSYAVSMRTAPTITPYGESGTSGVWSQAGGSNTGSASASLIGDQGFMQINISSLTAGNVYYGHYVATAEL